MEEWIGFALVCLFVILHFRKKKKKRSQHTQIHAPETKPDTGNAPIKVSSTITTKSAGTETFVADGKTISCLDIDGIEFAHNYDAEKSEYFTQQINSYGYIPPKDASTDDLRDILDRIRNSCDVVSEMETAGGSMVEYIRPLPGPSAEFARYAASVGVKFSKYVSRSVLFTKTVWALNGRDKAAFFAYCAICARNGKKVGDLRSSGMEETLYRFADNIMEDDSIMKSLYGREVDDYLNPNKGTKIYKAVSAYFGL